MTSDLALALFVVLGLLASLASRFAFRTWLTPVVVYFGVWLPVVILEAIPFMGLRPLLPQTWTAVIVAATAFTAGSFYVWLMVLARQRGVVAPPVPLSDDIYDRRLMRWFIVGLFSLVAWVGLQVVILLPALRAAGGLAAMFSNGLTVRRSLYGAGVDAATTGFSGGSLLRALLGYGLFLGAITLFWAPLVARRGHRILALAPLLIMAAYSFLTLSRAPLLYGVALYAFAFFYHSRSRRPNVARQRLSKLTILLVVILVALMVYIPLKMRQPDLSPTRTLYSVGLYLVGGIASLNEQIRQSGYAPSDGVARHGTWTFWGEATIASRLGLQVSLPPNNMPFVNVSRDTSFNDAKNNSATISNVYTYLIYFLNDFGFLGLLIGPFLLGAAATALNNYVRAGNAAAIPAAAILMASIVMSFFGLTLIRDARYLFVAFAAVFLQRLISSRSRAMVGDVEEGLAV